MNRLRFENDLAGGFANIPATGVLPNPLPKPLLLNLGCGNDIREGFLNLDLFSSDHRVIAMDVRELNFPDNCADAILASDILEHFSHREIPSILKEWARVLKPGAELIIRCPSLKLQLMAYMRGDWDADIASYMIFGGQTNPGDYHCTGFDEESIKNHLKIAGFDVYQYDEQDIPQDNGYINLNMTVRARKLVKKVNVNIDSLFREKVEVIQTEEVLSEEVLPEEVLPEEVFSENEDAILNEDEPLMSIDEFMEFGLDEEDVHEIQNKEQSDNQTFDIDLFEEMLSYGNTEIPLENEENEIIKEKPDTLTAETETQITIKPEKMLLPKLNIVWEGSQFVYHSLALINREHCSNLLDSNQVNLTIIPYEEDNFSPENNEKYLRLYNNDIRYKADVVEEISNLPYLWVRHQWPPKAEPPKGAKWIIMQPWEFTSLRKDFVEIFNNADEIWTPSDYARKSFVDSGVDFNKVQVIPNGINPEVFKPSGNKYSLNTNKKLKLLYIGGTIFRKGIDILLQVYSGMFSSSDDICLVVKDMGGDTFYKNQTAKDKIRQIQSQANAPEIIYIDENLTEQEITDLYRACDILVSPYRGEGFSLPTLEAMACGLTVVVTAGGATDEFVPQEFAYLINSTERNIGKYIGNHELVDDAYLLEPDAVSLGEILKFLYTNPSYIKSDGLVSSYFARNNFTWKKATKKILSRLDYLYKTNMAIEADLHLNDEADADLDLALGELLYRKGKFEDSLIFFEQYINSGSENKELIIHSLLRIAMLKLNEGDIIRVEAIINQCLKIDSASYDTLYVRALLELNKNNDTECMELITELLNNYNEKKFSITLGYHLDDLLVLLGDIFLKINDLEAAIQVYTEALKHNNENQYACYGAAMAFYKAELIEDSVNMLNWAVKIAPDFQEAADALLNIRKTNKF